MILFWLSKILCNVSSTKTIHIHWWVTHTHARTHMHTRTRHRTRTNKDRESERWTRFKRGEKYAMKIKNSRAWHSRPGHMMGGYKRSTCRYLKWAISKAACSIQTWFLCRSFRPTEWGRAANRSKALSIRILDFTF